MSLYIYTWTVLEPHNFRSLWIFGWGLKITFGLRVMDSMTQCWCQKVDLSRLFCVILRIFALYLWFFQMWLTEGKISNCSIFGRSLLFSPDQKKCSFWMSRYIYKKIHIFNTIIIHYMLYICINRLSPITLPPDLSANHGLVFFILWWIQSRVE